MTERPILYNGDMIRALRRDENPKTMTRRVLKYGVLAHSGIADVYHLVNDRWAIRTDRGNVYEIKCPFGVPGDWLYVKERQRVLEINHGRDATGEGTCSILVRYEADGTESWHEYPERLKWEPVVGHCLPYGGFRESSRITHELTDVRVERVQDISFSDCRAEGCRIEWRHDGPFECCDGPHHGENWHFVNVWDSCTKSPYKWDDNPWVWVLTFKRLKP